ncbi:MAG TPA: hypothetical protein VJI68_01210 [Candidatus Nanoarchaeia archaeon]|nr:hypothetical protein [Candidatus Nanoarchaeia archaeon]
MVELDIVEQKPLTMAELKEKFDVIKAGGVELNFRAAKVDVYLNELVSINKEKSQELYAKLIALDLRLRDRHIVKLIDTMPGDTETIKVLFSGESLNLKQEDLKKIADVING